MKKSGLLSATSAIALAITFASPAHAFDFVDWNWNSDVETDVASELGMGGYFYPTGLTKVERIQIKAGDVDAYVNVSGTKVRNEDGTDQPIWITQVNGALVGQIGGRIDPYADVDQANSATSNLGSDVSQWNVAVVLQGGAYNVADVDQTNSASVAGGDVEQVNLAAIGQFGGFDKAYVTQTNSVVVDLGNLADGAGLLDARKHLGTVEGAATAIQNVMSIESEHATEFHDGQVAFGDLGRGKKKGGNGDFGLASVGGGGNGGGNDEDCDECNPNAITGNQMHDLMLLASAGALFDVIQKGDASATIKANHVKNAAIDVSAVAAANIHTVDVVTDYDSYSPTGNPYYWVSDNTVIGDLSQFAYMDVSAKAEAKDQKLVGYSYLNAGKFGGPINSATATALGNVSSIVNKTP